MLFESEKKAETFIKFNSEAIGEESGYKPERCYFCIYCDGWHVTSHRENLDIKSRTEKILDLYEKEKEQKVFRKAEQQALKQAQKALAVSQKKEADALIHTQKVENLKNILCHIEEYIAILETSKSDKNKRIVILDNVLVELEKAKSLGVVFRRSERRIKEAEEKLVILSREIENTAQQK